MSPLILSNIPWRQLFLQPWLCPTLPALMPYRYLCRQSFLLNQGHSPPFLESTWSQHDTGTGKYNKTLQNTCTLNDPTDRPYPTVETHISLLLKEQSDHGLPICCCVAKLTVNRPPGYKTFFMLNSTEHEISTAHKN